LHYSPTQGFDEMFWIKGAKNLDITEQELQPKSAKKIDVLREFKKLNKNKTKNKIFLNNFIEIISKSA
jgi:Fic family protein